MPRVVSYGLVLSSKRANLETHEKQVGLTLNDHIGALEVGG